MPSIAAKTQVTNNLTLEVDETAQGAGRPAGSIVDFGYMKCGRTTVRPAWLGCLGGTLPGNGVRLERSAQRVHTLLWTPAAGRTAPTPYP
jgi:hypothetical protein